MLLFLNSFFKKLKSSILFLSNSILLVSLVRVYVISLFSRTSGSAIARILAKFFLPLVNNFS